MLKCYIKAFKDVYVQNAEMGLVDTLCQSFIQCQPNPINDLSEQIPSQIGVVESKQGPIVQN